MTIITNAGNDDRLSPRERRAAELEDRSSLLTMENEELGRRSAARRELAPWRGVPLEATDQKIALDVGGEKREFDGAAVAWEFDEPEAYDEDIPNLGPFVVRGRWVETTWWPVGPAARDSDGNVRGRLRPQLGPKAWSAILDDGLYCMRCLWRHVAGAWPEEGCTYCFLEKPHRERALEHLEKVGELWDEAMTTARQRAAAQRSGGFVTKSGIVLPGQMSLARG